MVGSRSKTNQTTRSVDDGNFVPVGVGSGTSLNHPREACHGSCTDASSLAGEVEFGSLGSTGNPNGLVAIPKPVAYGGETSSALTSPVADRFPEAAAAATVTESNNTEKKQRLSQLVPLSVLGYSPQVEVLPRRLVDSQGPKPDKPSARFIITVVQPPAAAVPQDSNGANNCSPGKKPPRDQNLSTNTDQGNPLNLVRSMPTFEASLDCSPSQSFATANAPTIIVPQHNVAFSVDISARELAVDSFSSTVASSSIVNRTIMSLSSEEPLVIVHHAKTKVEFPKGAGPQE